MLKHVTDKIKNLEAQRKNCKTDKELMEILVDIVWEVRRFDAGYALEVAKEGLKIAEKRGDQFNMARFHNMVATALHLSGAYNDALKHGKLALSISEQLKHKGNIVVFSMNLGNIYQLLEDIQRSIDCHYGALRMLLSMPMNNWVKNILVNCYNNLMFCYAAIEEQEKALEYGQKSYATIDDDVDVIIQSVTLVNMGAIYEQIGQYDKCITYVNRALKICTQNGDQLTEHGALVNLINAYQKKACFEEALSVLFKMLDLVKQLKQTYLYESTYEEAAQLFQLYIPDEEIWKQHNTEYDTVKELLETILVFAEKNKAEKVKCNTYDAFAKYYASQEQWELAYQYKEAYAKSLLVLQEQKIEAVKKQHNTRQQLKEKEVELVQQTKLLKIERLANERLEALNSKIQEQNNVMTQKADKLQSIVKEMENFAFITSHDLKEPLRSISSFLSLLKYRYEKQLDNRANEYIDFAMNGAKRLTKLIEDLLIFSRLGNEEVKLERYNLGKLIEASWNSLDRKETDLKAQITYPSNLPELYIQPALMQQLLVNLFANALKFRGAEQPLVQIHCKKKIVEGQITHWVLSVSDNGIGISKEYQTKVFEMFKRLHTIDRYEGTGIGLAICKKIMDLHQGRIWLESEVGKGTTFFMELPHQRENKAIVNQLMTHV
ncbi:MAG: ATP-binding protein [Chitinophagales bacterium]